MPSLAGCEDDYSMISTEYREFYMVFSFKSKNYAGFLNFAFYGWLVLCLNSIE